MTIPDHITGHRSAPPKADRGFALVIVLWGLVLLAVIAASFASGTRTETMLARNLIENAKAEAIADAGVYRAILGLSAPKSDDRWRADGTAYSFALGKGIVKISIQDEGGKIDLNRAQDELLRGLFVTVGLDADISNRLVDVIADFRDEDEFHRLHGAEDPDYRAAGLAYGAKDQPFEAVEELKRVMGMTPDIYEKVAPFLTVYSERSKVDLLTAPREVLLAVPGVDPAEIEDLMNARESMTGAIPKTALPVPSAERGSFAMPNKRIYSVRAEARNKSGAVFVREAVVHLTTSKDQPFRFYAWKRGKTAAASEKAPD